jgi:basic membrane protein A
MLASLGLPADSVVFKYHVDENGTACKDTAIELANSGCDIIFGTSNFYEKSLHEVAMEYPEVNFFHACGKEVKNAEESNTYNYFVSVYEARYVSGVVAGLKIKEIMENDHNMPARVKLGYVADFPTAEVKSGYTAFYLGAKSVLENVNLTMDVAYTNVALDEAKEREAALNLANDGCIVLSHHTATSVVAEVAQQKGIYFVGYKRSMITEAPDAALTSVQINWGPYYTYAVESYINGTPISKNWSKGFSAGTVSLTEINDAVAAQGTNEVVEAVIASIISGELKIFDTSTWTVKGKNITTTVGDSLYIDAQSGENPEYIIDGAFAESTITSAPTFAYVIDGITELK